MQHRAVAAFLVSLSLGLPCYAASGVAPSDAVAGKDHDAWVERIAAAQERVERATERYSAAVEAYGSMRHRRRERGEAKAAILQEQEDARAAAAEAEADLERVLEEARRAGVPPGWVREALARGVPADAQQH